jgi:hypothetical protein
MKQKKLPVLRDIQYRSLLFFNSAVSYTSGVATIDATTHLCAQTNQRKNIVTFCSTTTNKPLY